MLKFNKIMAAGSLVMTLLCVIIGKIDLATFFLIWFIHYRMESKC